MNLNYHELTMNEPRNAPARRQQFLVICTIMAGVFVYSFITSGGLSPVEITVGEFPGGDYVYKHTKRDYAASFGMARSIGDDLGLKLKDLADVIFNIYLDHPGVVTSGRQQRFASGLLIHKGQDQFSKKDLMAKNEFIVPFTDEDLIDLSAKELFSKIPYESKSLPHAKAAVLQFPYTDGFVSALIQSWKIIPALRAYAEENSDHPEFVTVVSTCSKDDQMCTHYAPLEKGKAFLLGQDDMKTYLDSLGSEPLIDFNAIFASLKKMFPFYKYLPGFSAGDSGSEEL